MKSLLSALGFIVLLITISWTNKQSNFQAIHQQHSNERLHGLFIDSLKIGIPGQFKLEIKQVPTFEDNAVVDFKFYRLENKRWTFIQSYEAIKDPISPLDIIISDYNGDGLNDLSFRSAIAARSINEIRSLFIFNKNHLDTIKNATDFPNLKYNKELNCLDAWMVHGGCTTVFLKLKKDSLQEFASVNINDTLLTVSEVNATGVDNIILKRRVLPDENLTRFKNYKPLKPIIEP